MNKKTISELEGYFLLVVCLVALVIITALATELDNNDTSIRNLHENNMVVRASLARSERLVDLLTIEARTCYRDMRLVAVGLRRR